MPASGRHRFTLLYVGLPSKLKEVDFIDGNWKLFGLRLDGKKPTNPSLSTARYGKKSTASPIPALLKKSLPKAI